MTCPWVPQMHILRPPLVGTVVGDCDAALDSAATPGRVTWMLTRSAQLSAQGSLLESYSTRRHTGWPSSSPASWNRRRSRRPVACSSPISQECAGIS